MPPLAQANAPTSLTFSRDVVRCRLYELTVISFRFFALPGSKQITNLHYFLCLYTLFYFHFWPRWLTLDRLGDGGSRGNATLGGKGSKSLVDQVRSLSVARSTLVYLHLNPKRVPRPSVLTCTSLPH